MSDHSRIDFTITDDGIREVEPGKSGSRSRDEGARKAARLLLALGPDQAATILKELSESEIEKLVVEMAAIKRLTADEKKQILTEFEKNARDSMDEPVRGGTEAAKEILYRGVGQAKADEILSRLGRQDLKKDFNFLEQIEPELLAAALVEEHPQVAAVALSFMHPRSAALVLKSMPEEKRNPVALRIAKTSTTHPDAVQRVAQVLRQKLEKRKGDAIFSQAGGAETLANILNHMDRRSEDGILGILGSEAPDVFESVKDRLYTFEELADLSQKEMRYLMSRIDDDLLIASALRGAGEEIRLAFFNAVSQNRAADILDEMDRRGPLSLKEINEARSYILSIARRLDDDGSLVIKKEKDEYI